MMIIFSNNEVKYKATFWDKEELVSENMAINDVFALVTVNELLAMKKTSALGRLVFDKEKLDEDLRVILSDDVEALNYLTLGKIEGEKLYVMRFNNIGRAELVADRDNTVALTARLEISSLAGSKFKFREP